MAIRLEGVRALIARRRVVVIVASTIAVVALGLLVSGRHADRDQGGGAEQTAVVAVRPFVSTIAVAGSIAAGDSVDLTAPFDGVVRRVAFRYGEPVGEGQILAEFDPAEMIRRRNEAEAAVLKASQTAADYAAWSTGPEVSRARRAAEGAASDLRDTGRRLEETRALLDRGLVPRSEFDALVSQERAQRLTLAAAEQDLTVATRRGEGADRRVAALELQNARTRLAEIDAQLAGAVLRAPVAGVIVRPPADKADAGAAIHPGLPMTRGQLVGAIARPGGLAVSFRLGEGDANRVRAGQPVTVTGPGFPGLSVTGRIASVAGEASPPSAGATASFVAVARLDPLSPERAAVLRIGMTANVVIETYRNPRALILPPDAVQGAAPMTMVRVRDPASGRDRVTSVRLGQVAPDGVEILSGLKPGETVVWTPPPPPPDGAVAP